MRMHRKAHRLCLAAVAVFATVPGTAAVEPDANVLAAVESRLRAIYERREFAARPLRPSAWLADSSGFLALEDAAAGASARELVQYDSASGARTVVLSLAQLEMAGAAKPLAIDDCVASADASLVLLQANSRVDETGGGRRLVDYWLLERSSGALREIVAGADRTSLRNSLSPDGRRLLYVREHNLYSRDLRGGGTLTLTTDGVVDAVMNGAGAGASWSPDGRQVAYVQSDSRALGLRAMLDQSDPTYPRVRYRRYARVGTTIPTLRVGVVGAEGGATRWLPIPTEPAGFYLGGVSWAGSSDELLVERLSRGRDAREFLLVNVPAGSVARMYRETDPAWVDASYSANAGLEWIRDGRAFVLLSEKDGWRHAYVVSRDGAQQALLTPGASDVIARGQVDERGRLLLLPRLARRTRPSATCYRARLDGTGAPERVSPPASPARTATSSRPTAAGRSTRYSTYDTPPVVELVELPAHRVVRVLEDNAGAARSGGGRGSRNRSSS